MSSNKVIAEVVANHYSSPLDFVLSAFPWGEAGTPLRDKKGPEAWQAQYLQELGLHIEANAERTKRNEDPLPWRSAVASGHGVGKSALVAWLIYFFMSTRRDTRGIVTASTQLQLEDKTWPELSKWHQLALNKGWFNWTATTFYHKLYSEDRRKNYMVTATTVAEHRTEAFAGLHNEGNTVFIIFDEASGVPANVWEVAEGALTDGEAYFICLGNPTRPDGEFYNCFNKHSHLYYTQKVDSREVSFTNKRALEILIDKFGKSSKEAKVRVYGEFPETSFSSFIDKTCVDTAMNAEDLFPDAGAALIMGIDVARYGDDQTVMGFRQGLDHRSFPLKTYSGLNTIEVSDRAAVLANKIKPDMIAVEVTGPGAGVIDVLKSRGYNVHEVHPGSQATENKLFANKRAELWSEMRKWLMAGGRLPKDGGLASQLTSITYTLDKGEQRMLMESKAAMKKRRLPSPDWADMLALTFAPKISRRDMRSAAWAREADNMAVLQGDPLELRHIHEVFDDYSYARVTDMRI